MGTFFLWTYTVARKAVSFVRLFQSHGSHNILLKTFSQTDHGGALTPTPSHLHVDARLRLELVSGYREESSFVSSLLRADRALLVCAVRRLVGQYSNFHVQASHRQPSKEDGLCATRTPAVRVHGPVALESEQHGSL